MRLQCFTDFLSVLLWDLLVSPLGYKSVHKPLFNQKSQLGFTSLVCSYSLVGPIWLSISFVTLFSFVL